MFAGMKTNFLFVLALFMGLAAHSQSGSEIAFVGTFTYNFDNEFRKGTIKLPKITNKRNGGTSGTLKLDVWLFENKYAGATKYSGYLLYTKKFSPLQGGYAYNDLKYEFDWDSNPPKGTYYVAFILTEYDPRGETTYTLMDYVSFSQTFEVKPKIDYDAFWDDL